MTCSQCHRSFWSVPMAFKVQRLSTARRLCYQQPLEYGKNKTSTPVDVEENWSRNYNHLIMNYENWLFHPFFRLKKQTKLGDANRVLHFPPNQMQPSIITHCWDHRWWIMHQILNILHYIIPQKQNKKASSTAKRKEKQQEENKLNRHHCYCLLSLALTLYIVALLWVYLSSIKSTNLSNQSQ